MGSVSLRSAPKREFYLETAKDMHHRASSETTPQAKEILLDIERSLRRLAEIESWSDQRVRIFAHPDANLRMAQPSRFHERP
jgi:hypothetical protein